MGITTNCAKFLFYAFHEGVSFKKPVMLGRQHLYAADSEIQKMAARLSLTSPMENVANTGGYSEPLFKLLGAEEVHSLDYSPYEGATTIHDLNKVLPPVLKDKYSVVFDGGTLEHVFNFPVAIKNCMDMLEVGGHFISITPTNNQCGHGFYQFSPELFYSVFSERFGFKVKRVLLAVDVEGQGIREWYSVADPNQVKTRVMLSNDSPTYLMVLAQKTSDMGDVEFLPYQSDYSQVWQSFEAPRVSNNPLVKFYKKHVPESVRSLVSSIRRRRTTTDHFVPGVGKVNPQYFQKVNFLG